jgi:hypothetical protein
MFTERDTRPYSNLVNWILLRLLLLRHLLRLLRLLHLRCLRRFSMGWGRRRGEDPAHHGRQKHLVFFYCFIFLRLVQHSPSKRSASILKQFCRRLQAAAV